MKILLIDHSGMQMQTREMLLESEFHCTVHDATNMDELHTVYQKDTYDIVVVDNSIEQGQALVDYILQIDPEQHILVVSDAPKCVIPRCGDCVEQYRIRRLNNPTPIKNIIRMVKDFVIYQCDHYDDSTNYRSVV